MIIKNKSFVTLFVIYLYSLNKRMYTKHAGNAAM